MGGKSYFCDYCRCYMKNDVNVRKTHNEGMLHRMNKIRYMRKYEDPRKIYQEEVAKEPCSHFFKGRCRYDLLCQNSHYTRKQLQVLKKIVEKLDIKDQQLQRNAQTKHTKKSITHLLIWDQGNVALKGHKKYERSKNLPPSLKQIKLKKLVKVINSNSNWGD